MDSFFQRRDKSKGSGEDKSGNSVPWVEKYRPARVDDVVAQDEAVHTLQRAATTLALPHLLFYGSPGTGKTSTILAIAHQFFPTPELFRERVLELNASDERGIDVVRHRIKEFAMCAAAASARVPGFKIVILDEADAMTVGAQQALRRTMEVFSASTRFALACNYSAEVIEPIQSRCAVVRFSRLADADVLAMLRRVADAEHVHVTDDGYQAILFAAEGDMRHAINTLQAAAAGNALDTAGAATAAVVDAKAVYAVADQPHPEIVRRALRHCLDGNFDEAQKLFCALVYQGYAPNDVVATIFRVLKSAGSGADSSSTSSSTSIGTEAQRLEFMREIGLAHVVTGAEGVNTLTQLMGLVARLCLKKAAPAPASAAAPL